MEVVDKLVFNLESYLNSKGFQDLKQEITGSKSMLSSLQSFAGSTFGQMAMGYFTITGMVSQYKKAIEASNYQIEQEAKLYTALRQQNFHEEQIKSIIDYAGALQGLGAVGDEVTLAGIQQLSGFRLQEQSLKALAPAMQDVLVKQKGLKGTGQDMVAISGVFGRALQGQAKGLQKAGIAITEQQEKLLQMGTEEQKVKVLVDAVRESIGEQNKEILKTPEGKIVSAQNRIGDLYEYWGMLVRETRADFWELVADNAEGIKNIVGQAFKAGDSFLDTFMGVFRDIKRGFNALPDGAKTGLKGITALVLATKFPFVALALAVEDVFAAFQGKESYTEDGFNALMKFVGLDFDFTSLRQSVDKFWKALTDPAKTFPQDMDNVTAWLLETVELLKIAGNTAQILFGLANLPKDSIKFVYDVFTEDLDTANENFNNGLFKTNVKSGATGIWNNFKTIGEITDKNLDYNKKKQEERGRQELERIKNGEKPKSIMTEQPNITEIARNSIQNKNIQIESKPTMYFTYTINEASDIEKVKKVTEDSAKKVLKEYTADMKYQYGGAFTLGY